MPRSPVFAALAGSRPPVPNAASLGRADSGKEQHVTIVLVPRLGAQARYARIEKIATQLPREREPMDERQFVEQCGAVPEQLAEVEEFARRFGLVILESSVPRRFVRVSGTTEQIEKAFQVELLEYEHLGVRFMSHDGQISLPVELHEAVEAVLGLDTRPVRRPLVSAEPASLQPMLPSEVAEAYRFPAGARGARETIAIVLPGGGLDEDDLREYFHMIRSPLPKVTMVEVMGEKNQPASVADVTLVRDVFFRGVTVTKQNIQAFSAGMNTVEASMDVELVGSFAPEAHILVLISPDNFEGNYHVLTSAITDPHRPSVISCSWSSHEDQYPASVIRCMETVFETAALCGITVCFSSGDDGDGSLWYQQPISVHYPSASRYVLGCGGTSLRRAAHGFVETAWEDKLSGQRLASGGGFSQKVKRPSWQADAVGTETGRGVPDVAGKADIGGGYEIVARGLRFSMGGTSAAAPMWASLSLLLNEKLGTRAGFFAPLLYTDAFRNATHGILKGNNGKYHAGPGWNPVAGWGSPRGEALLKALS